MDILYFAPDVSIDEAGDARSTHIREVCENWAKAGASITAILREPSSELDMVDGIQVKELQLSEHDSPLIIAIRSARNLLSVLYNGKFDVIYARHAYSLISVFTSVLSGTPHVVEINGIMSKEQEMVANSKLRYTYSRLTEKSYKLSDVCICVTDEIKDEFGIEDKSYVIKNGVNTNLFRPIDKEKACEHIDLSPSVDRVGFVGSLTKWQGVETLIRAAGSTSNDLDVEYTIVGDGPEFESLKQLTRNQGVSSKFRFVGRVEYDVVPNYINAMDVCVAPKKPLGEYSPLKIYEYMACAKPVIASDLDGLDLLENEQSGTLFTPENPDELAIEIDKLIHNPETRRMMGENGRKFVNQNHSWESVSTDLLHILKNIGR